MRGTPIAILAATSLLLACCPGANGRPAEIRHYRGTSLEQAWTWEYDGHARVVYESGPDLEREYEYDALGRLAVERTLDGVSVVEEVTNTWDAVGNLVARADNGGTTTFAYDDDDRLLSASGASSEQWTWSERGALLSHTGPEGTTTLSWDDLDRLVQVDLPSGDSVAYTYDVAGRLMSRTDADGERRCLPLPATPRGWDDCALTFDADGGDVEAFAHGPLGPASRHGGGGARFLWTGLQGQVVGTTDAAGAVTGASTWSPWGEPLTASADDVDHGWLGERYDQATGLVYLRARWYDPSTGRFLSSDRFGATTSDPRTLHRYAYSFSDPLNRLDRSGEFTLLGLNISISIRQVLAAAQRFFAYCIKRAIHRKALRGIGMFVVRHMFGLAMSAIRIPGIKVAGDALEDVLGEKLHKALCAHSMGISFTYGLFTFEYQVDACGVGIDRKTIRKKPVPPGQAWYTNCDEYLTHRGIDIVFAEKLPIELKRNKGTVKEDQLRKYCRFASRNNVYVTVYGFITMPEVDRMTEWARQCFFCWQPASGKGKGGKSKKKEPKDCGVSHVAGGVLIAFAANKGTTTGRFWAPDPSLCKD